MPVTYNPALVVVSALIAILAGYVTLELSTRLKKSMDSGRSFWLVSGSIAMGTGIWSMHFIAMLAFSIPITINYNLQLVIASLLLPIFAASQALSIVCRPNPTIKTLLGGSVFMGLGIAIMHYSGMAAMQMSADLRYRPDLLALSVLIAIAVSFVALKLSIFLQGGSKNVNRLKILSAIIMGFAVMSMHYTGMAAAMFSPNPEKVIVSSNLDNVSLAYLVCIFTIFVMGLMFSLLYIEPHKKY